MVSPETLQRRQVAVYTGATTLAAVVGVFAPASGETFEPYINPVIALLLYVTFLEIPFVRLRAALTDGRFVGVALSLNFLVVPVVTWGLGVFLPRDPVILLGAFMVLLTPCIDYVVAFTDLAGGDAERVVAITPLLLFAQLLLLPGYLWLFVGSEAADAIAAGPFLEAFLTLIVLPLGAAWATQAWADRSPRGQRWQDAMAWLPVPMMGLTLLTVIASQLPRVRESIGQVATVVPVYVAFLVVMPVLARIAAGLAGFDRGPSRALVFTAVTRNSLVVLPLALALPAGYELVPAVVVTQTLVELVGMVVLTRVVPNWLVADRPRPLWG